MFQFLHKCCILRYDSSITIIDRGASASERTSLFGFSLTKFHVSVVVRSAAYATKCPIGVLYLFGRSGFEAVASFGLPKPAPNAPLHNELLHDFRFRQEDVFVVSNITSRMKLNAASSQPFGERFPDLRFAAMARIFCGSAKACGLLLLADTSPRDLFSPLDVYLLRSHADQISALIELYMLRSTQSDDYVKNEQPQVKASPPSELSASRFGSTETEHYVQDAEFDGLKRTQTQLSYAAFHDYLTMLYNRQYFMDRLTSAFEKAAQNAHFKFAILLIDLDRFKAINDSLGHRAGDLLLIEVARRLSACTRPADVLARIGGDEFALLVEGAEEIASMEALAQRLIEELRHKPYGLSGQEVIPSCSVGVVEATKYQRMPEDILHDADLAMYDAKRRNVGYSTFVHSMHNEALKKMQMRRDLEKAVRRGEFFLEYQPIYRSATAELVGLEALIRWQHPRQGIMFPDAFIKAAEEFGFIRQMGSWALQEACTQLGLWKAEFSEPCLRVSVNVSGEQLKAVGFAAEVEQALLSSGLSPQALQLEVTESVLVESTVATKQMLGEIRSLGVAIALDDFGTGYSSLSFLDQYQIDVIKIDKSFTSGIPMRPKTITIIKAVIDLGTALGLEVVAEGVETEEQLHMLSSMSCEYVQGYLLSPPLTPSQTTRMLKTRGGLTSPEGNTTFR